MKARHRIHAVGVGRLRRWLASAFVKQRWPGGADARDPDVAEALAGLWVVNDRSDGSPSVEPELRLLAREGLVPPEPVLTKALARLADLPIEVGADWYAEAADSNRASSRLTEPRRMSLWNDPRRTARRLRSPVGA